MNNKKEKYEPFASKLTDANLKKLKQRALDNKEKIYVTLNKLINESK